MREDLFDKEEGGSTKASRANQAIMPQQLLLELSGASARSKGQARRRNQPAVSENARKAQRNLARRERAKCKKAGEPKQQLLQAAPEFSDDIPDSADSPRPSLQSVPVAGQAQYGSPSPNRGKAAQKPLEMEPLPLHPTVTVLPVNAKSINRRALAQSSRFMAAQSKARNAKYVLLRENLQRAENSGTVATSDRAEFQVAPQAEELHAAEILMGVAREKDLIPPAIDTESMLVKKRDVSNTDARIIYTRKCPVTTCPYHVDIGLWTKGEKDKHIMTHFDGNIKFDIDDHRYSLPWPSFFEGPEKFFSKVESLKRSIQNHSLRFSHGYGRFMCWMCLHGFDPSGYVEHLDHCIVHVVQRQASGTAQATSVPFCDSPRTGDSSRSTKNQHIVTSYWPSLGCGQCYTDRCQCPPMR